MQHNGERGAKIILLSAVATLFVLMYLGQMEYIFDVQQPRIVIDDTLPDPSLLEEKHRLKKILVWHYGYGNKSMGFGFGRRPFLQAGCKESRCLLTDNRKILPVEDFDAIVFHFRGLNEQVLPAKRSSKQRYVFFEMESASWIYHNPNQFDNVFNWTMTYRKDSDIWSRYGSFVPKEDPDGENSATIDYAKGKSKLAAWFVSNCQSMSWRERFVSDMQKWMPVDVYGKCGPLNCPRSDEQVCYKMLEEKYKFYLSFENSLCKDYVTEKLFNILRLGVIPVVFGGADYKSFAPPNCCINVMDFQDMKSLVNYLLYLDKNDTAYNEFFKWKKHYQILTVPDIRNQGFCDLCQKLHVDKEPKVYNDLIDWFITKGQCRRLLPITWLEYLFNSF